MWGSRIPDPGAWGRSPPYVRRRRVVAPATRRQGRSISFVGGEEGRLQRARPATTHRRATARRARHHRRRVDTNGHLGEVISELLGQRWSPQQISRHLRLRFPEDPSMWLCPESIYRAVYQPNSHFLRPSRLAPHRRSSLRTGRDHRRAHQCQQRRRPRFQQPMMTIHDRPFAPVDRSQAGHWESQWCCQAASGVLTRSGSW